VIAPKPETRVVDDLVVFKTRKGRAEVEVQVTPGSTSCRLEVAGGSFSASRRLRGTFERGATRRLQAKVGGLIVKEMSVWWAS